MSTIVLPELDLFRVCGVGVAFAVTWIEWHGGIKIGMNLLILWSVCLVLIYCSERMLLNAFKGTRRYIVSIHTLIF